MLQTGYKKRENSQKEIKANTRGFDSQNITAGEGFQKPCRKPSTIKSLSRELKTKHSSKSLLNFNRSPAPESNPMGEETFQQCLMSVLLCTNTQNHCDHITHKPKQLYLT